MLVYRGGVRDTMITLSSLPALLKTLGQNEVGVQDPLDTKSIGLRMFFMGEDAGTTGLLPG